MLISVKNRFVFIANSKTASTTIENILTPHAEINRAGSPQRKHISWLEARYEYSFLFDQKRFSPETFFRFGVVREPADWVRSWFNYRRGNTGIEQPLPQNMLFEEFWSSDDWVKSLRQKNMFIEVSGECLFDLIIPQEKLHEVIAYILRAVGSNSSKMPMLNKSPGQLHRKDLPAGIIDAINQHYAEDYEFYMQWKERFLKGVDYSNLLEQMNGQAKQGSVVHIESTVVHSLHIHFAKLDVLPVQIKQGEPFTLGGLVVLVDDAPHGCSLELRYNDIRKPIQWGISSPWVAEKFPKLKNAPKSRFQIDDLNFSESGYFELVILDDLGNETPIYKISF